MCSRSSQTDRPQAGFEGVTFGKSPAMAVLEELQLLRRASEELYASAWVDVTPDMAEAGAEVLRKHRGYGDGSSGMPCMEVAAEMFLAMLAAA